MKKSREINLNFPNLDVQPEHLQIILDVLKKHVPQFDVFAFGSRAKWTARESSDLDLVIMTQQRMSLNDLGELKYAFDESDLPFKVDLTDWTTLNESLRKIIECDGVLLVKGTDEL